MTVKRFACILAAALTLQGAVFAICYRDLLYLRRPVSDIVAAPPELFVRHATQALERRQLTAGHLETIASAAAVLQQPSLEVRALQRRQQLDRADRSVRLRLADALRRAGDYAQAEHIYLDLMASGSPEAQR